jgi:hypothetical protein
MRVGEFAVLQCAVVAHALLRAVSAFVPTPGLRSQYFLYYQLLRLCSSKSHIRPMLQNATPIEEIRSRLLSAEGAVVAATSKKAKTAAVACIIKELGFVCRNAKSGATGRAKVRIRNGISRSTGRPGGSRGRHIWCSRRSIAYPTGRRGTRPANAPLTPQSTPGTSIPITGHFHNPRRPSLTFFTQRSHNVTSLGSIGRRRALLSAET